MNTHLDLFSGIGGFALAAQWAGYETIQFVEIDTFCQRVLAKHWPEVPCHDDIRSFDATPLRGQVQLLTGGFPCQPFSVAGERRGEADDRHLWPEMRRIIAECRPAWIVAENVPGIINMALDDVLADLESLGYETGALVIPAASVGAPHLRQRLWIVAHADRHRIRNADVQADAIATSGEARQVPASGGDGGGTTDVPDPTARGLRRGRAPGEVGQPAQPCQDVPDAEREGSQRQRREHGLREGRGEVKSGRGGWWESEPGMGRVAHGVPNRVDRLKSLGNAIVPQVAYEIIKLIPED